MDLPLGGVLFSASAVDAADAVVTRCCSLAGRIESRSRDEFASASSGPGVLSLSLSREERDPPRVPHLPQRPVSQSDDAVHAALGHLHAPRRGSPACTPVNNSRAVPDKKRRADTPPGAPALAALCGSPITKCSHRIFSRHPICTCAASIGALPRRSHRWNASPPGSPSDAPLPAQLYLARASTSRGTRPPLRSRPPALVEHDQDDPGPFATVRLEGDVPCPTSNLHRRCRFSTPPARLTTTRRALPSSR